MGILRRAALIFKTLGRQQALLESAVTNGDHHAAAQLLDAGVKPDFNMQGQHPGTTPLMHAAGTGDLTMIRLLLAAKASPLLLLDKSHLTAWHIAAGNGQTQAVALFLDAGVDIDAIMEPGNNALVLAAANGQVETVQLLCDRQADVNLPGYGGRCALHWSCDRHDAEITRILLKHGAHIDALTDKDYSPLMMLFKPDILKERAEDTTAAQKEILALLLAAQSSLEQRDSWQGETALHLAVREKAQACACTLIAAGANVQATNNKGQTPMDLAAATTDGATLMIALQKAAQEKKEAARREKTQQFSDVRLRGALRPLRPIRLRAGTAQ